MREDWEDNDMSNNKSNGYVIWESAAVVAIATGFRRRSANRKTGDMVQIWLLVKAQHPAVAKASGQDAHICGECPFRAQLDGGCYVDVGKAPAAVWRTYRAGGYPKLESMDVFDGRHVRFGAYGDPTLLPLGLLERIAKASDGWTGYTHQWANPVFKGYSRFLMASADDPAAQIEAWKAGWRTFRVAPKGSDWRFKDEISCPASKEAGERTTCAKCRLCCGTSRGALKNITIQKH